MLNVRKREVLNSHYGARSMHSGKVILITGGTGQVGTAAAAALLRRGCRLETRNNEGHQLFLTRNGSIASCRPGEHGGAAKCDCGCLAAVPEGRRRPLAGAVG